MTIIKEEFDINKWDEGVGRRGDGGLNDIPLDLVHQL